MSKIVSANRNFQAPLLRKSTAFLSRVDGRTHISRTRTVAGGPPPIQPPADTTFYAPLNEETLTDYVNGAPSTFTRNTEGTYKDINGVWRIAGINEPRLEQNGLLLEPSSTNQNTNYNTEPNTSLSGILDGGATITAVSATADLAAAGLSVLVPDGYVFEANNETAGTVTVQIAQAQIGYGRRVAQAWINSFGNTITFGWDEEQVSVNSTSLERYYAYGYGAGLGANRTRFILGPGQRVQWILNDTAARDYLMTPIIVNGTTVSRSADYVEWDVSANPVYNASQGMAAAYIRSSVEDPQSSINATNRTPLVSFSDGASVDCVIGLTASYAGDTSYSYMWDTGQMDAGATNEMITQFRRVRIGSTWDASTKELLQDKNDFSWFEISSAHTSFPSNNKVVMGKDVRHPVNIEEVRIWNVDKGLAWLKDNI